MSSQPLYRLNWLREEQGGHLTGHDTAPTVSLDSLPINETLAARILAATPLPAVSGDAPPPPLYLPFVSFRDRFKWPTRQMELPVTATPDGRIVVGSDAEVQMAGLIAGQPTPFVFSDQRRWDAEDWDARVAPLLHAHHMETPPRWRPAGPVDVTFTVSLSAAGKRVWHEIPHRREADFLEQFRGLSTSIQRALRHWMPYQYFNRPSRYSKPLKCQQYLVYSELPAFPSRRKTQLTFHVLEPQRVIHSMSRLAKPLSDPLRKAVRRARGLGFDPLPFMPDRAAHILRTMHKMPRVFGALLSLEAFLVEEFILFAATCFDLREEKGPRARAVVDPALGLRHRLNCRLARSYGGESYENLLMLIMTAATDGLQRRAIEPHRMDCRAVIADARTGLVEFELESKTSYATSEIGRPLLRVG